MKNIHLLSTDKSNRGLVFFNGTFRREVGLSNYPKELYPSAQGYNIYITSDEEIRVNDYITDGYKVWKWKDNSSLLGRKKITLTTDQDLIKDGVQAIDDEFLEWFIKNPSCEEIEIFSQNVYSMGKWDIRHSIIIPKEESELKCDFCKRYPRLEGTNKCESCYSVVRHFLEQDEKFKGKLLPDLRKKQETLEEVAEKTADNFEEPNFKAGVIYGVIEGAKWQSERMYSEEEVKEMLFHRETHYMKTAHHLHINEWFEQFRKK